MNNQRIDQSPDKRNRLDSKLAAGRTGAEINSESSVRPSSKNAPVGSRAELHAIRKLADKLIWKREQVDANLKSTQSQLDAVNNYLEIAEQVTEALDVLSQKLFEEVLDLLKDKLSIAIQEVLDQPVSFNAQASFKRGAANVEFSVERAGNREDVNRGQGGSVQNVLSVGLRLFALARLDPEEHRRFLVLDEQDCWLRSELVPKLVKIVHRAAQELDFQVIMISHHDVRVFEEYADKIYHFDPVDSGVKVTEVINRAIEADGE